METLFELWRTAVTSNATTASPTAVLQSHGVLVSAIPIQDSGLLLFVVVQVLHLLWSLSSRHPSLDHYHVVFLCILIMSHNAINDFLVSEWRTFFNYPYFDSAGVLYIVLVKGPANLSLLCVLVRVLTSLCKKFISATPLPLSASIFGEIVPDYHHLLDEDVHVGTSNTTAWR